MAKAKDVDGETIKALKENLRYDPETGLFWWTKPKQRRDLSKPAGCIHPSGYAVVSFGNKPYRLHRLAFIFMGETLPEVVDHINRVTYDNRWANLRAACQYTNLYNQGKQKSNTTGYKGVSRHRGNFTAEIFCKGVRYYLGYFDCPKEAHKAYCDAADKLHKEYKNYG